MNLKRKNPGVRERERERERTFIELHILIPFNVVDT